MTKPCDEETRFAREGLAGRINAIFFRLMAQYRVGGKPTWEAVQNALDDINKALRRTEEAQQPACNHLYSAIAGSPIGDGVCIKCGAREPPPDEPPAPTA